MQPSPEMQSFVNACEFRHKTYIDNPGDKLKMRLNDDDLPLVFERLSPATFRVAHERIDQDGQLVADPEVIFFTGYEKWIAMEVGQPYSLVTEIGRRRNRAKYVELNGSETSVREYKVSGQKALADFVKKWTQALRSRCWHEDSTNAVYRQGRFDERGDVEGIIEEMDEQLRRDGMSMTVSSGTKTATIGQPQA
jgi:hypothetical protein